MSEFIITSVAFVSEKFINFIYQESTLTKK